MQEDTKWDKTGGPVPHLADDMRDGDEIRKWKYPLGQVITYIHASLYETYAEYDREAIAKQRYHRWFSLCAVFFGSIAIILAIIQVFLKAHPELGSFIPDPGSIAIFEKGAFLTALIAVAIALGSRLLRDWLTKRYLAEQCRSLKFRALIHPYLSYSPYDHWNERFAQWKDRFDSGVSSLKKRERLTLEEILVSDEIRAPPLDTSSRTPNAEYLVMLLDYYKEKRITTQLDYLSLRTRYFQTVNRFTERIPEYCFLGGVACSGILFGIEIFSSSLLLVIPDMSLWEFFQALALLVTLLLPSIGIAARTMRSSIEVSRNASLSSAKCRALQQFSIRLSEEQALETVNWQKILSIMWECENFLESENREWLRIMHDAEWFL